MIRTRSSINAIQGGELRLNVQMLKGKIIEAGRKYFYS